MKILSNRDFFRTTLIPEIITVALTPATLTYIYLSQIGLYVEGQQKLVTSDSAHRIAEQIFMLGLLTTITLSLCLCLMSSLKNKHLTVAESTKISATALAPFAVSFVSLLSDSSAFIFTGLLAGGAFALGSLYFMIKNHLLLTTKEGVTISITSTVTSALAILLPLGLITPFIKSVITPAFI